MRFVKPRRHPSAGWMSLKSLPTSRRLYCSLVYAPSRHIALKAKDEMDKDTKAHCNSALCCSPRVARGGYADGTRRPHVNFIESEEA